jgi:hypothetical protein
MFVVILALAGGFEETLAPMTGEELQAMFDRGISNARPKTIIVDGVPVAWATFKTIFNLALYDAAL